MCDVNSSSSVLFINACLCLLLLQGYSTSQTWYAVMDYGTNYCNLFNLIQGVYIYVIFQHSLVVKRSLKRG